MLCYVLLYGVACNEVVNMEKWRENKKKYISEYKKTTLKRVPLDMQLSDYEKLKSHVTKHSETINGFIKRAISETMERDNSKDSE